MKSQLFAALKCSVVLKSVNDTFSNNFLCKKNYILKCGIFWERIKKLRINQRGATVAVHVLGNPLRLRHAAHTRH